MNPKKVSRMVFERLWQRNKKGATKILLIEVHRPCSAAINRCDAVFSGECGRLVTRPDRKYCSFKMSP